MIKLLHLADVHIGMENYGRLNPETGLNTRLHDFLDTLDEAVTHAIDQRVDAVVVAGDVYKSRDPSPTHQRELARRIIRLIKNDVHVVLVPGNHDTPMAAGRATSVDIFRELELPNVTVLRRIAASRVQTRSGPFQVVALPWLTRSTFLAHDDFRNLPLDELVQQMAGMIDEMLQRTCAELDPNIPAVLVGHAHVFGARVGAERLLTLGNDPMLNASVLDLPNVGYHALGHIHKHQAVVTGPRSAVYAGSINRVDFSEEDEKKGFVVVELQNGKSDWEFVPVKARPFLTIRSEPLTDAPTDEVVRAILKAGPKVDGAIVRLQLSGPRSRVQAIDEREVRRQLAGAHFLTPIQREYTDEIRQRVAGAELQGKTPLELLALYFERQSTVSAERRELLLARARDLMEEGAR
ncbi:MAG TPA: exonuclease SbcCD subunit D [Chloroflexota bacterium]|nr:exonuclease SbcCD subunit D [Chloroflexota bacterium]